MAYDTAPSRLELWEWLCPISGSAVSSLAKNTARGSVADFGWSLKPAERRVNNHGEHISEAVSDRLGGSQRGFSGEIRAGRHDGRAGSRSQITRRRMGTDAHCYGFPAASKPRRTVRASRYHPSYRAWPCPGYAILDFSGHWRNPALELRQGRCQKDEAFFRGALFELTQSAHSAFVRWITSKSPHALCRVGNDITSTDRSCRRANRFLHFFLRRRVGRRRAGALLSSSRQSSSVSDSGSRSLGTRAFFSPSVTNGP